MANKRLTLLEQALIEEKKIKINKFESTTKGIKNNYELLKVLLPNYKPQLKQKLFHKSCAYEKGLKGGYGAGKTIALCAEAIALSYLNKPQSIIIASPTVDNIEQTTLRTLKDLCKDNNLQYDWQNTRGLFKIMFGQKDEDVGNIYLIGQVFFKGPNVAAVGFDEPFSQRKETYENLIARVRNAKAKKLEIFWAGTPEPQQMEWGLEYFEKDHNEENLFTITIPTIENKYLPGDFYKNLFNKFDARTREVYLEGKYILLTANRVYYAFEREKNLLQDYNLREYEELILSFDFNVDPMTAVAVVLNKGIFYQIKEFNLNSSNTAELCSAVIVWLNRYMTKWLEQKRSVIITGDATGRKRGTRGYLSDYEIIRDEFTKANIDFYFNVPKENPAVRDRINFVNKLFESERFFIDENCIKSIKDRELVSWKQNAEGFIIDKSKKDLTHLSDCGDYAVYNNQILLDEYAEGSMILINKRQSR